MDFFEVEGKKLLEAAGIQTDHGILIDETTDLTAIRYPCVAKAQVLSGKRGKAGGIRIAENPQQLKEAYDFISTMKINGHSVSGVFVTGKADICEEHYIGLTIDRKNKCILLLYSPCGGMDIEEVAASTPEKLVRLPILDEFDDAAFLKALDTFRMDEGTKLTILEIAVKLYQTFVRLDATTIEINPLIRTAEGSFLAIDCKLVIDDNALYRQKDYTLLPRTQLMSRQAEEAAAYDLSYVELNDAGGIGMIAGGAGIGMATVDAIKYYGEEPFNFLDLGGGVSSEKMYHAVDLLLKNPKVDSILVNVFGGINNCLTMAEGVCRAIEEDSSGKLVVVKSRGFSQEEGWALYDHLGLPQIHYGTTDSAVKLLLKFRKGATK